MDRSKNYVEARSWRLENKEGIVQVDASVGARSTSVVSSNSGPNHQGCNGTDSQSRMSGNGATENKHNQSQNSSQASARHEDATSSSATATARTHLAAHNEEDTASRRSESNESMEQTEVDGDSSGRNKKTRKPALRKGKWAVEEEEYTSRVIQHFSAGLLTLPDGATLRSYLAEKLNCDPMRITKKFTGACCLGRRVYHLRDRPRPTPGELEMAKAERDHLEHRVRIRIEHEQSGLPMSRSRDAILVQPQSNIGALYPMQNFSTGNTLSPWLQNLGPSGLVGAPAPTSLPSHQTFLANGANQLSLANLQQNQAGWLIPGVAESIANNTAQNDPLIHLLSQLVTSWAVAQAAASLPPGALASLAAAAADPAATSVQSSNSMLKQNQSNPPVAPPVADEYSSRPIHELQQQLRNTYEEQIKEEQKRLRAAFEEEKRRKDEQEKAALNEAAVSAVVAAAQPKEHQDSKAAAQPKEHQDSKKACELDHSAPSNEISPAEQLQKSYEAHLQALKKMEAGNGDNESVKSIKKGPARLKNRQSRVSLSDDASQESSRKKKDRNDQPMPDEEAGTVLLGFLNSLRRSYEDAVEEKTGESNVSKEEKNNHKRHEEPARPSSRTFPTVIDGDSKRRHAGVKRHHFNSPDGQNQQRGDKNPMTPARYMNTGTGKGSQRPASVTDTSSGNSSSQQAEFSSSLEDSSDKSEPSSSEDSDKEASERHNRRQSKGPPRKRLKSLMKDAPIAHSKRAARDIQDY